MDILCWRITRLCDYLRRSGATDPFSVVEAGRTKRYTEDNRPLDFLEMNGVNDPLQESYSRHRVKKSVAESKCWRKDRWR